MPATGSQVLRYSFNSFQPALKRIMDNGNMELDIIVNPKVTRDGESVIQVRFLCRLTSNHQPQSALK